MPSRTPAPRHANDTRATCDESWPEKETEKPWKDGRNDGIFTRRKLISVHSVLPRGHNKIMPCSPGNQHRHRAAVFAEDIIILPPPCINHVCRNNVVSARSSRHMRTSSLSALVRPSLVFSATSVALVSVFPSDNQEDSNGTCERLLSREGEPEGRFWVLRMVVLLFNAARTVSDIEKATEERPLLGPPRDSAACVWACETLKTRRPLCSSPLSLLERASSLEALPPRANFTRSGILEELEHKFSTSRMVQDFYLLRTSLHPPASTTPSRLSSN